MNLFEWLLIGHLIGDYALQHRWMAVNKSSQIWPLVLHSMVYTGAVAVCALPAGGVRGWGLVVVFLSHTFLDSRHLVQWWVRKINGSPDIFWLQIMIDQTFHLLVLVLVVQFFGR